jgi:DNA-binding transcriptional ArsR family regulator
MELKEEKLARAISAFSRRQIIRLLSKSSLTVKEVSEKTKMSVSLASRHLKMLYDLGFLNLKKEFPYKYYSLKNKQLYSLIINYDLNIKSSEDDEKLSRAINAYSRRQILRLLSKNSLNVKVIANKTKMSVSLASRHLKMLHDLGFLVVKKEFPFKYYSLKNKSLIKLLQTYDETIKII